MTHPTSPAAKPASRHPVLRVALVGFGLLTLSASGQSLVGAWNRGLAPLILVGLVALPSLALGALCVLLGAAGQIQDVEPGGPDGMGTTLPSTLVAPAPIQPHGRLEVLLRWMLGAWIAVCLLGLAKGISSALLAGVSTVPVWGWVLPLTSYPAIAWIRRRGRFLRRWGRCQLRLLEPARRGKPFSGFIEARTRFEPTRDFQFRLTYHHRGSRGYGPPDWTHEQIVGRDRLQIMADGCRIPVLFPSLHRPGSVPDPRFCHRWWLEFRTELDGQPYTECFHGAVPMDRGTSHPRGTESHEPLHEPPITTPTRRS